MELLPVDIIVKILLYLDDRGDILSCFLTCKYFYKVTEKYNFWTELCQRYSYEFTPIANLQDETECNCHGVTTLRDAFRSDFHSVDIKRYNNLIVFNPSKFNNTEDQNIAIFLGNHHNIIVVEKNLKNGIIKLDPFENYYRFLLEQHRNNYYIRAVKNELDVSFVLKSKVRIITDKKDYRYCDENYYDMKNDNVYHLYRDFIILMQKYFKFDQIKFRYDYELYVTLINASIIDNSIVSQLDNINFNGDIDLILNPGCDIYGNIIDHTILIYNPNVGACLKLDINLSEYGPIIN